MSGYQIMESLYKTICSEEFLVLGRTDEKSFLRNRKAGFTSVLMMIMSLMKRSSQLELDDFMNKFAAEKIGTYTKQSFSEARQKITPDVFKVLNKDFLKMFYTGDNFFKHKGYRLMAIDGSKIQIPNNKNTREKFGFIHNNWEHFEIAQALTSTLYDIENDIVVSTVLERCDESERALAKKNIEEMLNGRNDIKNLILFDRGYPSFEILTFLEEKQQKYLMRVKECFFKETQETKNDDEIVSIEITPSRKKHLKQQGFEVEIGAKIEVRVVKAILPTGEIETLITNLPTEEFSTNDCKELYFKRWGIETKYDELKNKFEIENFSGSSVAVVKQDFFATAFLSNIATLIENEATSIYESKDNSKKNTSTK